MIVAQVGCTCSVALLSQLRSEIWRAIDPGGRSEIFETGLVYRGSYLSISPPTAPWRSSQRSK